MVPQMPTAQVCDAIPGVSEDLIASVTSDAEHIADLVIGFLDEAGVLPPRKQLDKRSLGLPAEFLGELGAALRLRELEQFGLRECLDDNLPAADELILDVLTRF